MNSVGHDWIYDYLKTQLPPHQLDQAKQFLRSDSWISPSARKRLLQSNPEEIPLRFRLDIDVSD
ncbi:hypothetical protein SAMN05444392_101243 [Seinonella peptonophila]|uniref:Uncharacterized protein n=1 Tax=Seinonella peptonophila TaxID=112248 RepID=A0A1M4T0F0_9BACL|nr:hypothetical protein [Seinonella peptonophila]SHE37961.1 hypothetical protein SAMN05444392_101243 [Seinonella peptonophila]